MNASTFISLKLFLSVHSSVKIKVVVHLCFQDASKQYTLDVHLVKFSVESIKECNLHSLGESFSAMLVFIIEICKFILYFSQFSYNPNKIICE